MRPATKRQISPYSLLIQASCAFVPLLAGVAGFWLAERPWWPDVRLAHDPGALRPVLLLVTVALFPMLRNLQRRMTGSAAALPRGRLVLPVLSCLPAILGLLLLLFGGTARTLLLMCGISLVYLAFMSPFGSS